MDLEFVTSLILFSTFQDIQRYKLDNPRSFRYLNQSNCYELDGVDDSKEYLDTRRAMDIVGISSEEQVCLKMQRQKNMLKGVISLF